MQANSQERLSARHTCNHKDTPSSGRYKAQLVEGSGNAYLRTACDYVHLNPARVRLLKPQERLLAYPWSSLGAGPKTSWRCALRATRPGWPLPLG
jgi:hypothetical protein